MENDLFAVAQNTTIDPLEARITLVGYMGAAIILAMGLVGAIAYYGERLMRWRTSRNHTPR